MTAIYRICEINFDVDLFFALLVHIFPWRYFLFLFAVNICFFFYWRHIKLQCWVLIVFTNLALKNINVQIKSLQQQEEPTFQMFHERLKMFIEECINFYFPWNDFPGIEWNDNCVSRHDQEHSKIIKIVANLKIKINEMFEFLEFDWTAGQRDLLVLI